MTSSSGGIVRPSPWTAQPTCGNKGCPNSTQDPHQLFACSAVIVIWAMSPSANVIRLEHASAVSHDTYNNAYQFSLHTDSDTMAALCMTKVAASTSRDTPFWPAECPPVFCGRDDSPPPGRHRPGMEAGASDSQSPRIGVCPSSAPGPLPTFRALGIPAPFTTASTGFVHTIHAHDHPSERSLTSHVPPYRCPARLGPQGA